MEGWEGSWPGQPQGAQTHPVPISAGSWAWGKVRAGTQALLREPFNEIDKFSFLGGAGGKFIDRYFSDKTRFARKSFPSPN